MRRWVCSVGIRVCLAVAALLWAASAAAQTTITIIDHGEVADLLRQGQRLEHAVDAKFGLQPFGRCLQVQIAGTRRPACGQQPVDDPAGILRIGWIDIGKKLGLHRSFQNHFLLYRRWSLSMTMRCDPRRLIAE